MQGQLLQVAPYLKEKRQLTQLFWGEKKKQNKTNCFENAGQPLSGPESNVLCGFLIHLPLLPQSLRFEN